MRYRAAVEHWYRMRMNRANPREPRQDSKASKRRSSARRKGSLADRRESADRLKSELESREALRTERRKDLQIALIAAFAVLVSGGVSAFVSWRTNESTLESQRLSQHTQEEAATAAYLRDARQKLYAELIAKSIEVQRISSELFETLKISPDRPTVTSQQLNSFIAALEDFGSDLPQLHILSTGSTDLAASGVFTTFLNLEQAVRAFQHALQTEPIERMRPYSDVLMSAISQTTKSIPDEYAEMYRNMRKDLGFPDLRESLGDSPNILPGIVVPTTLLPVPTQSPRPR